MSIPITQSEVDTMRSTIDSFSKKLEWADHFIAEKNLEEEKGMLKKYDSVDTFLDEL